jgi:hypothetical protein
MSAPHVQLLPDGSVQLRLSPEDTKVLTGHDQCKLMALQDRVRQSLVVPYFEAALKSEAVAG